MVCFLINWHAHLNARWCCIYLFSDFYCLTIGKWKCFGFRILVFADLSARALWSCIFWKLSFHARTRTATPHITPEKPVWIRSMTTFMEFTPEMRLLWPLLHRIFRCVFFRLYNVNANCHNVKNLICTIWKKTHRKIRCAVSTSILHHVAHVRTICLCITVL